MFKEVGSGKDFPEMERRILRFWEEERIFEKLREKNRGNKPWSFIDGPITANNPMGVHHAWGRTYKDIFQRFKAMQGFDERYQNGFDCQGLWVEVEVEKELGLNSKRDIVDYGLDNFARKCRERVEKFSAHPDRAVEAAGPVDGLGALLLHDDRHQHRVYLALPQGLLARTAGSTKAVARCRGALGAAHRSPSTS